MTQILSIWDIKNIKRRRRFITICRRIPIDWCHTICQTRLSSVDLLQWVVVIQFKKLTNFNVNAWIFWWISRNMFRLSNVPYFSSFKVYLFKNCCNWFTVIKRKKSNHLENRDQHSRVYFLRRIRLYFRIFSWYQIFF